MRGVRGEGRRQHDCPSECPGPPCAFLGQAARIHPHPSTWTSQLLSHLEFKAHLKSHLLHEALPRPQPGYKRFSAPQKPPLQHLA